MEEEIGILFFNFIFTGLSYEILPLFSRFILKEKFNLKEAKRLAILNSLLIFVIFSLLHLFVLKDNKLANIPPAFFWGYISYLVLEPQKDHSTLDNKNITEEKNTSTINCNIENRNVDYIAQIERLSVLYKDGYITEDEFNKEKQKILNKSI